MMVVLVVFVMMVWVIRKPKRPPRPRRHIHRTVIIGIVWYPDTLNDRDISAAGGVPTIHGAAYPSGRGIACRQP
jgi:hypothetical protein